MRRFATYLFFLTLMVHTFSQVLIVGQFLANQSFIAEELCENQDKPELECNGQCYLMKQLQKAETKKPAETEEERSNPYVAKVKQHMISESSIVKIEHIACTERSEKIASQQHFYVEQFEFDIFHPPRKLS